MRYFLMVVSLFVVVGCSGNQTPTSSTEEQDTPKPTVSDASISFGILDVIVKQDVIHVTGEARTTEDSFYYILEYDDSLIVEETEVELNDEEGEWRTFSFETSIENEEFTDKDALFYTLYVKEDGKMLNPNYIPVDLMIY